MLPKLAASVTCLCLIVLLVASKVAEAASRKTLLLGAGHTAAGPDVGFCVLTLDSRFSDEDLALVATVNHAGLEAAWALHPSKTLFSHTLRLNAAYTLRHNYSFMATTGAEYEAERAAEGMHWSWMKLAAARDTLARRPDCRWLMWLDSDAFLWMDHHGVRLEAMFATTNVHELSRDFFSSTVQHMQMHGNVPLRQRPHVHFMVGLNGVSGGRPEMGGGVGFPTGFLSNESDYLCAGTWVVRNSPLGAALIQNWWDSRLLVPEYKLKHPFEQTALNRYTYPKFQYNVSVYSYLYFTSPYSPTIRHLWTSEGNQNGLWAALAVAGLQNNTQLLAPGGRNAIHKWVCQTLRMFCRGRTTA